MNLSFSFQMYTKAENVPMKNHVLEDGGEIGGREVHFPSASVKSLADLRNRENSQRYSSICEDRGPKIVEDIERSDGKKSD